MSNLVPYSKLKETVIDSLFEETVPEQAYLVGKGGFPENPSFPSKAEDKENYMERLKGHIRGGFEMKKFNLSAVSKKVTEGDISRQVNMINGREVSGEEFLDAIKHNPLISSYTNQNLMTPVSTEVFMRYTNPQFAMVNSGGGLIVNYYQEDGQDCLEGIWLGELMSMEDGHEVLYHIDGRIEVNLATKEAQVSWELTEPSQHWRGRPFDVNHVAWHVRKRHFKRPHV